jgi:hypothetical protein
VVTVHSQRAGWHGGAIADGPVVASWWQGVVGELVGITGRAPGKEGAGGAHRGWRRNDGAERSAQDGGVLMEGSSGDRRRVRRGPAAQGGQGGEEMAVA